MKKILAIVLALMLLTASVAMAETASVLVITDPVLTTTADGQTTTLNMAGLQITLSMGNDANGVPTIQLDADNGGEKLLGAELQYIGDKVVFGIDGMSRPFAAQNPAGTASADQLAQGFAAMEQTSEVKLPAFKGVEIPKIDLTALGEMIGAQSDGSFELPYEMVNMLLAQLSSFKDLVPENARQYTDMLFNAIDQMQQTNSGFTLKGNIADAGDSSTLTVDIIPVSNGTAAAAPAATVTFYTAANQINLDVDANADGQSMKVGQFALTSIPDQAELNFVLDMMGMLSFAGSLYPQDGAQVVALELTAMGQKMNLSFAYGENEGADFVDTVLTVEGKAGMELYVETTSDGNGNAEGAMSLTLDNQENNNQVAVNGDIYTTKQDITFRSIENVDNAINVENMSEEESELLNQELGAVMGNVMNYLATLTPAA